MSIAVNFTFIVHSPYVLDKGYNYFRIGRDSNYFDIEASRKSIFEFSDLSYLPTNAVLLDILKKHDNCKLSFLLSNTLLHQLERFRPDVIESFQDVIATNQIELLSGTGYNSLAFHYPQIEQYTEFASQIKENQALLQHLFGIAPKVLLNTELIYSNHISKLMDTLSIPAIITEGTENVLGWRSRDFVYQPKENFKQRILFRDNPLSNAIAFNFSNSHWKEYPLTADKFINWLTINRNNVDVVNIVLDYETFGYYQPRSTGIFEFLSVLLDSLSQIDSIQLSTPSEIIDSCDPVAKIDVPNYISWTGSEQDISPWMGNELQRSALEGCYDLREQIIQTGDNELITTWRLLQSADYIEYMNTRWINAGYTPHTQNNFSNAEEAYIIYNNIINDIALKTMP